MISPAEYGRSQHQTLPGSAASWVTRAPTAPRMNVDKPLPQIPVESSPASVVYSQQLIPSSSNSSLHSEVNEEVWQR